MESVWEHPPQLSFETLMGNKHTDVLIIGGGIAGILCACKLKNAGVDYMLVDAEKICGGVTKNTTAKITLGHGLIYNKLIKCYGKQKAKLYLDDQINAIKEYALLCQNIDCDYKIQDNYVYSLNDRKKIEKEVAALNHKSITDAVSRR